PGRERLRERDDAGLGSSVAGRRWAAAQGHAARDVDDGAAGAALDHVGDGGTAAVERAVEVDLNGVVPVVVRQGPELLAAAAGVADAGVVDEDVELAVP